MQLAQNRTKVAEDSHLHGFKSSWKVRLTPEGTPVWISPDGKEYLSRESGMEAGGKVQRSDNQLATFADQCNRAADACAGVRRDPRRRRGPHMPPG